MKRLAFYAIALFTSAMTLKAEAQLDRGDFRFSIDADMLSMASVEVDPEGPVPGQERTYFGVGPNQLGGARVTQGLPTPVGLGFGKVLSKKLVLGVRVGLGLDVEDRQGDDNNERIFGISLMPNLTFVPIGQRAKLFLQASPIFQASRRKTDGARDRYLLGGVGIGIGTFIFVTNALSVDLGFHFEGRFGGYETERGPVETGGDLRDLRGVVRLGLSLWS